MDNTDCSQFESDTSSPVFLDVETTTSNKGHPFDPRNKLVSYVIDDNTSTSFVYFTDPDFRNFRGRLRAGHSTYIGFNVKFDLHWCFPDVPIQDIKIWDCQLAEFIYSGQQDRLLSLDTCLERYNLPKKRSIVVHDYWAQGIDTDQIPVADLKDYNLGDVEPLKALYNIQQQLLSDQQKALVLALGEDMKVLMEMERNGIVFNKEGAKQYQEESLQKVKKIEEEISTFLPPIQHGTFNYDSGDHLSALLYGATIEFPYSISSEEIYKSGPNKGQTYIRNRWFKEVVTFPKRFKPLEKTEVKKTRNNSATEPHFYQVDEPTLKQLTSRRKEDKRLVEILLLRAELIKVVEMLDSIFKLFDKFQWQDNIMHPQYNQNIVITGRLSSSNPNGQNMPPEVEQFLVSRYD